MQSAKRGNVIFNETVFSKLSPVQQKILSELTNCPLTLSELSKKTGSSVYTVGKQLSLLQMRAAYNPLIKKGIDKPLVKKNKEEGKKTTYHIALELAETSQGNI